MRNVYEMRHRLKFGGKIFSTHATLGWCKTKREARKQAEHLKPLYFVRVVARKAAPFGYDVYTRPKGS